jgi:hypothetical protein
VGVTVDDAIEAKIAELVAARRPVLDELVRQAVDAELVAFRRPRPSSTLTSLVQLVQMEHRRRLTPA